MIGVQEHDNISGPEVVVVCYTNKHVKPTFFYKCTSYHGAAAWSGMKRGAANSQVHPLINPPAPPAEDGKSYIRVVVGGWHPDLRPGAGGLLMNLA